MKNVLFFITHKTLDEEHANATLYSISKQECESKFDAMYIYNSHSKELSNERLLELCEKYNVQKFVNEIKIFPYVEDTNKSLGADVYTIRQFCRNNFAKNDRILLLKSDCVLSKNFFKDIFSLPNDKDVFFTAPFICAKERITDEEIFEYASRDKFIRSDDITFFVEDQTHSGDNDFNNRPGVNVTDERIRFTSCCVITDYSCHLITNHLIDLAEIQFQSWGGVKFYKLTSHYIGTDRSFVIHKYHDIKSENRSTTREGPVETWLTS